jgi:putative tryptophan/tyrosine transport system ATP-binding protein
MQTILELKDVALKIPGLEKPILNDINYQVTSGDFVVILGSNGSGKSSLLKLIDGTYQHSAGTILLDNKTLKNFSQTQLAEKVVTLTQDYNKSLFCTLTVLENCLLAQEKNKQKNKKDVNFFTEYLARFNPNLPKKFKVLTTELSGGEKQALALALSVLHPPEILLLDEHTSALDPQAADTLMHITTEVVRDKKITCLMTTHDLDIALQYGNRVLVLQQGEVLHKFESAEKAKLTHQILRETCY